MSSQILSTDALALTDLRSYHGAIQEAIEQAGINGNQNLRASGTTSETIPNYSNLCYLFPYAHDAALTTSADRNNATGVPLEVNQANILLPLAPD